MRTSDHSASYHHPPPNHFPNNTTSTSSSASSSTSSSASSTSSSSTVDHDELSSAFVNYPSFILKADSLRVVFSLISSIYELRKDQYAVMAVNAKGKKRRRRLKFLRQRNRTNFLFTCKSFRKVKNHYPPDCWVFLLPFSPRFTLLISHLLFLIYRIFLYFFVILLFLYFPPTGLRISIENISRSMYATALLNRELFSVFDIDGIHMDLPGNNSKAALSSTVGEIAFRVSRYP